MTETTRHTPSPALVASHSQTLAETKTEMDRIAAFIDGNGTPGAKVRLAQLEAKDVEICEKIDGLRGEIKGLATLFKWIIGTLFTIVMPFIYWTITSFIPQVMAHLGAAKP